jgi:hypothetical protein
VHAIESEDPSAFVTSVRLVLGWCASDIPRRCSVLLRVVLADDQALPRRDAAPEPALHLSG